MSLGPSSEMPRVCHFTSVHASHDTRVFQKECRSLARAGYEVYFVVPGALSGEAEGVHIVGIPKPRNRWLRFSLTHWHLLRATLKTRAEICHFHDPDLIPLGMLLKSLGRKVVYDVHEHVPNDMLDKEYLPAWIRKPLSFFMKSLEGMGATVFDGIVAATQSIAAQFPARKTSLVQNYPVLSPEGKIIPYAERPKEVVYVGFLSKARGAREMVRAMEYLPENTFTLTIAGEFSPPSLKQEVEKLPGWRRVNYLGFRSRAELGEIMGRARVGIVLFHPIANHVDSQPNKLFEYMEAGLPLLVSHFPAWKRFVKEVGCGMVVDPLDPKAIAEGIQWMEAHPEEAQAMGERGKSAVHRIFNWEAESHKLLDLYRSLCVVPTSS